MPSGRQQTRTKTSTASADFLNEVSDEKTAAFVKKVLCNTDNGHSRQDSQLQELLPPLTSSNAVDLQLYALIAIVIQESIYSWYSNITPDKDFVNEVIQIIAHCTRALEQRLRKADLEKLIFDDATRLVDAHVQCKCKQTSSTWAALTQRSSMAFLQTSKRSQCIHDRPRDELSYPQTTSSV